MFKLNEVNEIEEVNDFINAYKSAYYSGTPIDWSSQIFASGLRIETTLKIYDTVNNLKGKKGDLIKNFKEIMDTRFSGCSKEEMNAYIESSDYDMSFEDIYFNCLDLQKDAIVKLFHPSLNQDEQGYVGQSDDIYSD